jgi:hypothetical protein
MGRITSTQIQERQDKLNQWINDFLDNVPMTSGLIAQLHTFFQVRSQNTLFRGFSQSSCMLG